MWTENGYLMNEKDWTFFAVAAFACGCYVAMTIPFLVKKVRNRFIEEDSVKG